MRDIIGVNDNYSLSVELYNALQKINPEDLERIGAQNRKTISVALKNFTTDNKKAISKDDLRTAIDSLRAKELPTIGFFKKIAIEIANLFHTSVSPVGILEQKEKIDQAVSSDRSHLVKIKEKLAEKRESLAALIEELTINTDKHTFTPGVEIKKEIKSEGARIKYLIARTEDEIISLGEEEARIRDNLKFINGTASSTDEEQYM